MEVSRALTMFPRTQNVDTSLEGSSLVYGGGAGSSLLYSEVAECVWVEGKCGEETCGP